MASYALLAPRLLLLLGLGATFACGIHSAFGVENFNGNSRRGADLVKRYGCGGCHEIPGIANADGNVGPSLRRIATRTYIAGFIQNSPDNMTFWIEDPQKLLPGNAMPSSGISQDDARDITAFLYTLK
ncbi:c-type cytochrome [Bradyrhizobium sp. WSM 1704]|uniref:c-type cytochrome n=1 Tax=Bradyrhizobium semiaridum TaxID=2821404 RepID=UPI001CE32BBF|nr:c-type cytochrome [Bradyrhizobium semiaridum]MCA6125217.1 c-type cytochrome [Bradyrhizobium semiaridum]